MFLFTVGSSNAEKFLAFACLTFAQYEFVRFHVSYFQREVLFSLFTVLPYVHLNVHLPIVPNTSRMVVEETVKTLGKCHVRCKGFC